MKPLKSFFFLITVFAILAITAIIFPENGIIIGKATKLNFPSIKDIINPSAISYANINNILKASSDSSSLSMYLDTPSEFDTIRADITALRKGVHPIEFPDQDKTILYKFFKKLLKLEKSDELIRILHFGDSQIEGDRITSYLRYHLQKQFGGSGPGLISVTEPTPRLSINRTASSSFKRYTVYGGFNPVIKNGKYGIMGSYCRFSPPYSDSLRNDTNSFSGWINITKSKTIDANTQNFNKLKIFYGNQHKPFRLSVCEENDKLLKSDTLYPRSGFGVYQLDFAKSPESLTLKFRGMDSPDIYALALDGNTGVAVDNIPQRGSSGVEFTRQNQEFLSSMFLSLNVKLVIMEYGVNMVPNVLENYNFYEKWFYSNLVALKKLDPELCIIVIGVSDMSLKAGDHYESYPNIEKIKQAQKNAAFMAGCAFWDLYEAMGGKNSMPSWVFADPPLAQKDFTHFSPLGARLVAEMFYKALICEYYEFLASQPKEPVTPLPEPKKQDTDKPLGNCGYLKKMYLNKLVFEIPC